MLPHMATLSRRLSGVQNPGVRVSKGARATAIGRVPKAARVEEAGKPEPRARARAVAAATMREAPAPPHILETITFGFVVGTGREKTEFLHDGRNIRQVGRIVRQILEIRPVILVVKFRLHGI